MKAKCVRREKNKSGLTISKEYIVINTYGIANDYRVEIINDDDVFEEYRRSCFEFVK